jgi:hypothetical protein
MVETGTFWLLLSHMKWYLGVSRAIIREAILAASGRLPGAGRPDENEYTRLVS